MVETFKLKCNKILIFFSIHIILFCNHLKHIESSNEKKPFSFFTVVNIEKNQKKLFFFFM